MYRSKAWQYGSWKCFSKVPWKYSTWVNVNWRLINIFKSHVIRAEQNLQKKTILIFNKTHYFHNDKFVIVKKLLTEM